MTDPGPGHNSGPSAIAVDQLRSIIERVERLEELDSTLVAGRPIGSAAIGGLALLADRLEREARLCRSLLARFGDGSYNATVRDAVSETTLRSVLAEIDA